jgi:hypothetical protein
MLIHSEDSKFVNGSKPVGGRGIKRRKLSPGEKVKLAADLATGVRPYTPSVAQACAVTGAPQRAVTAELKARRENGHATAAEAIVIAWYEASEHERELAVRTIGVAQIWNVISGVIA